MQPTRLARHDSKDSDPFKSYNDLEGGEKEPKAAKEAKNVSPNLRRRKLKPQVTVELVPSDQDSAEREQAKA